MSQRILSKFTILSNRGTKARCEICDVKFQLLVKQEHQCKRCMRSVCEDCGPEKRTVYEFDGSWALHRCCLACIREIEVIQEYQHTFKLCFGQDSQFVEDWVSKLNKEHKQFDEILNEYTDNLTTVTNDNTIRLKREADALFHDLMDSCNYSLRHFLHDMIASIKFNTFTAKVLAVTVAVYARVKTLPYVPELVYLSAFVLCFSGEAHAYFIITRLLEKVYPQYVRVKKLKKDNLLSSSLKTILEMYRICVDRVDRNELEVIAQYLQSRFEHLILSFTLNVCSMPNSFFILDEMLKSGNYLALYKGIASLLSYCREEIAAYQSFSEVEIPMLREVTLEKLKSAFVKFEKTDIKFEVSNDVFDSAEHRKLYEKYKQMESLYARLEDNLKDKEAKLKEMSERLTRKGAELDEQTKKVSTLQTELLSLSEHLPQLVNLKSLESKCEYALARNLQLERKCEELENRLEKSEKETAKYEKSNRMWSRMEEDYLTQMKQLKTKNEILEIKVAAKEIDFNTSSIERMLSAKNNENQVLRGEVAHLKSELEYYKLKVLEHRFSLSNASKTLRMPTEDSKDEEFRKHIQHSNQIVQTRTKELEEKSAECMQKGQKIVELQGELAKIEEELREVQEISAVIKSIPEEFSYEEAISQLERAANKETNFIRKKTIESGIEGFRKCHKELRFRIIDARIKEEKIKNSFLIKLLNPATFSALKREEENKRDELMDMFAEAGSRESEQGKNPECSLM